MPTCLRLVSTVAQPELDKYAYRGVINVVYAGAGAVRNGDPYHYWVKHMQDEMLVLMTWLSPLDLGGTGMSKITQEDLEGTAAIAAQMSIWTELVGVPTKKLTEMWQAMNDMAELANMSASEEGIIEADLDNPRPEDLAVIAKAREVAVQFELVLRGTKAFCSILSGL